MPRLTTVLSKLSSRALITFVAYDLTAGAVCMGASAGMAISERLMDLALIDIYLALLLGFLGALLFDWRQREELF